MSARSRLIAILILLTLRSTVSAGGFSHEVHPSARSWWRFDPSSFASAGKTTPERVLFLATIRAAIASGLFGDGTSAKVIEGILAASDVGAVPHTLSLLEFDAQRPPGGTGIEINELRMVLELHTDRDHERYLRTIRAILVDAQRAKLGEGVKEFERQRILDLPDGSQAVAFSLAGWPEWRQISWCSRAESFIVAIGAGALEQRFAEADAASTPWSSHERAVEDARPEGDRFFSAFLDLAFLRSAFPVAFQRGRTPRMAEALSLSDRDELMLHGRFVDSVGDIPPLLVMDATMRDLESDAIVRAPGSIDSWLAHDVPAPVTRGSYILASPVEWPAFARTLLEIYEATIIDTDVWKFRRARTAWERDQGERFARVLDALEPWVVISDDPTPLVPVPGLSTYIMPIKPGADLDRLRADMAALLEPWGDVVTRSNAGIWTLSIHDSGLVRFPSWSIVEADGGRAIVAGWGPQVIARAKTLFSSMERGTSRSSGPSPRP